jgi:hypothetical protein
MDVIVIVIAVAFFVVSAMLVGVLDRL